MLVYLKQMYTDVMTMSTRTTITTAPNKPTPTLSPIRRPLLESESSCDGVGSDDGSVDAFEGKDEESVSEGTWEVKCDGVESEGEGAVPVVLVLNTGVAILTGVGGILVLSTGVEGVV